MTPRKAIAAFDVALIVAVLAVYVGTVRFDFVTLDDRQYVTENPMVSGGLTASGLVWAFTTFHASNWHPLTWISLMIDAEIGGMAPSVFHATNVLLHLASTLLLFHLLAAATGALGRSAFVAACFAVHPLHVESVAWVTERKDVLSTLFWFAALALHIAYARRPSVLRYAGVVAMFVLSLLAKPMAVTLPLTLLLFDFWPLARRGMTVRRHVVEKAPLLVLSAASSAVTLAAQGEVVGSLGVVPFALRVQNAAVACVRYIGKMLWPFDLSIHYPYDRNIGAGAVAGAVALLLLLTVLALRARGTRPFLAFGWLWFLVTLVPVIGLVQVGLQGMADRYAYVPFVGLYVIVSWGVTDIARGTHRNVLGVGAALVIALLGWRAHDQASTWRNSLALFRHAVEVNPENALARMGYAERLAERGQNEDAIREYREALGREPNLYRARLALAGLLVTAGRTGEAGAEYAEALRLNPGSVDVLTNLAVILLGEGRVDEAEARFAEAVRLAPQDASARAMHGVALSRLGRTAEAESELREALRLDPKNTTAHRGIAVILGRQGRIDEAIGHLRRAIEAGATEADARVNLATLLLKKGDAVGAEEQLREALRIDPASVSARRKLGSLLLETGRGQEAAAQLSEAARLAPDDRSITEDSESDPP